MLGQAPARWQRGSTACTGAGTSLAESRLRRGTENARLSFTFCFRATATASKTAVSPRVVPGWMMDSWVFVKEPVPRGTERSAGEQGAVKAGSARELICHLGTCTPVFAPAAVCWEQRWQIHRALPLPCGAPSDRGAKTVGAERVLGDRCCHLARPFFLCAAWDGASRRTRADEGTLAR